ncbi:beta-1,4-galactosyltransferase 4-like [Watersipora subatra]|uniref:beta-1,4-galactosyltransferase 4-like n=1 Tax=Watersipora subatra TaxID=2589382 RepID=UPI00355B841B
MTKSDHGSRTLWLSCSYRLLKHGFLAAVIFCFASVFLMRLSHMSSITVHVNRDKDEIQALNDSEKLKLVQNALLTANHKLPPIVSSSDATEHNHSSWAPEVTTPLSMNTVQDLDPALLEAFKFLYEGAPHYEQVKVKGACPAIPSKLIGSIQVFQKPYPFVQLNSLDFHLSGGGSYSPPSCNPSQKLAVIIPFRKRSVHLSILLLNLHPFLQKQQRDYTIFVVNQLEGSKFNRALLMNIGFMEAMKRKKYTCIVFHDVDLLPENDLNIYSCPEDNVRHMSAYINKFNYQLPYNDILGGVVAINSRLFVNANGYSNQFFGWGGEDDDFSARCRQKGMIVVRYPKTIARYKMIQHLSDSGNEANPQRFEMLKHTAARQNRDGLNSLIYSLSSVEELKLYTRINVKVEQRAVMNAEPKILPDFLQSV